MMHLFFVDESGNTGSRLDDPQQPVHCLVAVGIEPEKVRAVEDAMAGIADAQCIGVPSLEHTFEFHGADICGGRGDFEQIEPSARVQVYEQLMRLLTDHGLDLFCLGIDKPLHQKRACKMGYEPYPPQEVAFMYLAEELDRWLEAEGSLGVVVADSQPETEGALRKSFGWWRRVNTAWGYKPREIRFLLDTIHYVPSNSSWLIQLADCVAYLWNRSKRAFRQQAEGAQITRADQVVTQLWTNLCLPRVRTLKTWPDEFLSIEQYQPWA